MSLGLRAVHHIAIICSDYARSRDFYTRVLGLRVIRETHRPERSSYKVDLEVPGGVRIEMFSFPNPPERVSNPEARGLRHLAFEVEDPAATAARLEALGGRVEPIRVDPLTGKRYTFFADPDGLPLELYEA